MGRRAPVGLVALDIMQRDVHTVRPDLSVVDLERTFCESRQSGFPVVSQDNRLVGVVSRADIVRKLAAEHREAEDESAYYWDVPVAAPPAFKDSLDELAIKVGQRLDDLRVDDVMSQIPITVTARTPVRDVARTLIERKIHRLPVVDSGALIGIITSTDLVRILAEGREV
jgi:CBS domain-containing protein